MKYILVISLLWIVGMCNKDEDLSIENKTIYFQYEYINHAWTYQHEGFIVDQNGNIYHYEKPEDWVWAEDDQISKADFEANLAKAEKSTSNILSTELEKMQQLAMKANYGKLTEAKAVMADAGGNTYSIYIADENNEYLHKKLLQTWGDFFQKNTSNAADEIVDWLSEIGDTPEAPPTNF